MLLLRQIRPLLCLCFLCCSLVSVAQSQCKTTHLVQKKETLYGISRQYGLTQDELIAANPEIKDGGKIRKGDYLCIPYSAEEIRKRKEEEEYRRRTVPETWNNIKVGVILPFTLNASSPSAEASKALDLYEGMLLAIDSLKATGLSVDVYAFDEAAGQSGVKSILQNPTLQSMNLVVGPLRSQNVEDVARFCSRNKIVHVVPVSNREGICGYGPLIFQVNVAQLTLYNQIYSCFINKYKGCEIVLVNMSEKDDIQQFFLGLKHALDKAGVLYKQISFADFEDESAVLSATRRNVIVPSSASSNAFDMLSLKLNNISSQSHYTITMFGYPEWQTFAIKSQKNMAKYTVSFFTNFYSNTSAWRNRRFNTNFEQSFCQQQVASYPRYGELGYDIAAFFLSGIKRYTNLFPSHVSDVKYSPLLMPLRFKRLGGETNGFANTAYSIVNYNADGSVNVERQ